MTTTRKSLEQQTIFTTSVINGQVVTRWSETSYEIGTWCKKPLTLEQADAILSLVQDFRTWTGGFTPDECEHTQLVTYAKYARNKDLDEQTVLDLLVNYSK